MNKKNSIIVISIVSTIIVVPLIFFLLNYLIFLISAFQTRYDTNLVVPFHRENITSTKFFKINKFRKPSGLEYNKNGIIIFGCGYAEGLNLEDKDTLAAQLSKYTKRPVYNRALASGFIQHSLFQVESEKINDIIKKSSDVIYIISCNSDLQRLITYPSNYFDTNLLASKFVYLKYAIKKDPLELEPDFVELRQEKFPIITSSCIARLLQKYNVEVLQKNYISEDKLRELALAHLETLNKQLKKVNPNIKLHIVLYWDDDLISYLRDKDEEENNLEIISLVNISDNMSKRLEEYRQKDNSHPTKEAWEYLTPILAKELKLK